LRSIALGAARDSFATQVRDYFSRWQTALTAALKRLGLGAAASRRRAEAALLSIQGALVLARAMDDPKVFSRAMADLKKQLLAA